MRSLLGARAPASSDRATGASARSATGRGAGAERAAVVRGGCRAGVEPSVAVAVADDRVGAEGRDRAGGCPLASPATSVCSNRIAAASMTSGRCN